MKGVHAVVVVMFVVAGIALSGSQARPLQAEGVAIQRCGPACSPLAPARDPWERMAAWAADDGGCRRDCDAGLVFFEAFHEDDAASLAGGPWGALQPTVISMAFDPPE